MKRLVFSLVALLTIVFAGHAELLWKVEGNGVKKPSYLFGTHHIAPLAVLDSVQGFQKAFDEVDHVYGEVVMSELMSQEGQQLLLQAMMAPSDSTLSKLLSPAQLDSVSTALSTFVMPGATAQMFEAFKPAMLKIQLAAAMSKAAFPDFDIQQQLDGTIQANAAAVGKAVGGLETIQSQIDVLTGDPLQAQAEDLMEMLSDIEKGQEQAQKLASVYRKGDLDALLQLMSEDEDTKDALDALIFDRNRAWVKEMGEQLPEGGYMYVVGAGHLPGGQGVIELLRKAGYTVSPM